MQFVLMDDYIPHETHISTSPKFFPHPDYETTPVLPPLRDLGISTYSRLIGKPPPSSYICMHADIPYTCVRASMQNLVSIQYPVRGIEEFIYIACCVYQELCIYCIA